VSTIEGKENAFSEEVVNVELSLPDVDRCACERQLTGTDDRPRHQLEREPDVTDALDVEERESRSAKSLFSSAVSLAVVSTLQTKEGGPDVHEELQDGVGVYEHLVRFIRLKPAISYSTRSMPSRPWKATPSFTRS